MNETIFILGLGETLKFFNEFDKPKIGVNDIWSRVKTEMVVCVDSQNKFDSKRLQTIKESKPEKFYSHIKDWGKVFNGSFNHLPIHPVGIFKEDKVYYSNNSPFVAASLAYTLGYKNIVIYGADFNSHTKLKGLHTFNKILSDFKWLKENLNQRGVKLMVGHRASRIAQVLPLYKPL